MSGDHYSDDYRHGFTNGHAAGRQAAYDGEEPKGYGQALRDMTARALAAEESVEVCKAMISQLIGDVEIAEGRGRAHGLLAAVWTLINQRTYQMRMSVNPTMEEAQAFAVGVIDNVTIAVGNDLVRLAVEASRDE